MGICCSSPNVLMVDADDNKSDAAVQSDQQSVSQISDGNAEEEEGGVPAFRRFSVADIRVATNIFSTDYIVSKGGESAPNVVYKAWLHSTRKWVAVKRFRRHAWPDPEQFAEEACEVGRLRHKKLVNLLGYCCEGDERLLVAEFMPNNNLAKHLFHWDHKAMEWPMRLKVAFDIIEVLDHCYVEGHPLYHDLNSYQILFDENGDPRLSCFGLMKNSNDGRSYSTNLAYAPPEYLYDGTITPESVVYSYGTVLLDLLSGKHIPPSHVLRMDPAREILRVMDSHLDGNFSVDEAVDAFDIALWCFQEDPRNRPRTIDIGVALEPLRYEFQVPSYVMLGIPKAEEPPSTPLHKFSPMADACSRMDLMAVYEFVVKEQYKGDEGRFEPSLQEWTDRMRDMLETRKRGDLAFQEKDFKTAIECYTKFISGHRQEVSPTVRVRRSLSYLMSDPPNPQSALLDGMQAQFATTGWSTPYYIETLALTRIGMHKDATNMLREALFLEENKDKPSVWKRKQPEKYIFFG